MRTPNPSAASIVDWGLTVDQDEVAAVDEVVRRLRENLPGAIAEMNSRYGWTGNRAAAMPPAISSGFAAGADDLGILESPSVIADSSVDRIYVGWPECVQDDISPGASEGMLHLVIVTLHPRVEIADQRVPIHRRRQAIVRTLGHPDLATHVRDENDYECWNSLRPDGWSWLPHPYEQVSGIVQRFLLHQTPFAGGG